MNISIFHCIYFIPQKKLEICYFVENYAFYCSLLNANIVQVKQYVLKLKCIHYFIQVGILGIFRNIGLNWTYFSRK